MENKNNTKFIKTDILLNYIFAFSILSGLFYLSYRLIGFAIQISDKGEYLHLLSLIGLFLFSVFLAYGGLVYIFARHGYFKRLEQHYPPPRSVVENYFVKHRAPSLIILLPSYKEEIPVIRQSLLSCALQNYPNRHVVLLIDNPPNCPKLEETKSLVVDLNNSLKIQHQKMHQVAMQFQERIIQNSSVAYEKEVLIKIYQEIRDWFIQQAKNYPKKDHTDDTFINLTFNVRSEDLKQKIDFLKKENLDIHMIEKEYKLLENMFKVDITSFERKQYHNFSHASNKSMNLNSYLSVLGKNYKKSEENGRVILKECHVDESEYQFSDTEYVSVLDADSILTYDYSSRLIYEMEQPHFAKTAVIQTPYSAFPNPPGVLEKIAGATTDMQYMIHQGFTYFGATFWVGANALIRKKALEDIVEHRIENNYRISRYVQDRTVIEDTESSIDLSSKGWQLYNFPERLSYSATPPDFGALIIQRKRWANGGLIILPKVLACMFKEPFSLKKMKESFFRIHYLLSIPAVIFSLVLMQFSSVSLQNFPLEGSLLTMPYLIIYGRDLRLFGYCFSDLFRIMSLNIVLIPVNLAGVLQSLKQIIFGKQTLFCRTPKISGLTPIPLIYLFAILCMFLFEITSTILNSSIGDGIVTLFLGYGLISLFDLKKMCRT